jgi:sulfur carrier protein ThiS
MTNIPESKTYRDLLFALSKSPINLLDQTMIVLVDTEFLPVYEISIATENDTDVVDPGHIYLKTDY